MGRPRKVQNDVALNAESVEISTETPVKQKEITDPFWVIDPRSRIIKRLWSQEELSRHLARGWMQNG